MVGLSVTLGSRSLWYLVRLLVRALGAEDPFLVDLSILIKVPCQDLAVPTRSLALLNCLTNIQLALLNLQREALWSTPNF